MKKRRGNFKGPVRVLAGVALLVVVLAVIFTLLLQGKSIPVFDTSGIVANHEKSLILFTLGLSAVVVIPVFLMLGIFAWRYRENGGKGKYTPDEEDNHWFEALWWGIPIFIIGILCIVTWVSTHALDPRQALNPNVKPLTVQVVAMQWRWLFIYPDQNVASINELRIPVGRPVKFELTADGPMSGFWIPALGSQVYAMPAMSMTLNLEADKPGSYRGSNSNISGTGYADMDFQTIAMPTQKSFDDWATAIRFDEHHQHMAWDEYQALAKPTRDKKVQYFHLHDSELYTEVVEKFAGNQKVSGMEGM